VSAATTTRHAKRVKSDTPNKLTAPDRSFGKLLRVLRGAKGYTQEGLARRARMPRTVLAALERSAVGPDNESTLYDLAAGLRLDTETLVALIDAYVGVRK
jgi:transcriptional regulator with XRE-family HTH domain